MQHRDPEDVVEELRRLVAALGVRRIAAGIATALVLILFRRALDIHAMVRRVLNICGGSSRVPA